MRGHVIIPKRGKIKPIEISSHERRGIDEKTVTDLMEALARDGRFLQQIAVRDEGAGASGYRLISGHHRLEASKRHFGEPPIPAIIYPSDTPDALIELLEIEENLFRKELTAAERDAQMLRYAAARKKLDREKLASESTVSGCGKATESGKRIPGLAPARGGRGNKGLAREIADKVGVTKRAVNMRRKAASIAIGEKIDLDRDTPEELERKAAELEKADKRQRAEPKVVRQERRKPAPRGVVEDPTPAAEPHAGEIDSQIEALLKAFDAIGRKHQLRLVYYVCIRLGLDPSKMAPLAAFGLADEEPELDVELPAEVAPATDDAVPEQAEQQDDAPELGAEDLEDAASDVSEPAGQEPELTVDLPAEVAPAIDDALVDLQAEQREDAADVGAEDLQDAGDDVPEATDLVIGVKERCAHCNKPFLSSDLPKKKYGRFWHRKGCLDHAKPIAIAAE